MNCEPWKWRPPQGWTQDSCHLKLYSSYHNATIPFVPWRGANSLDVDWYACGPTVYEVSHIGHARNYLSADIIRRVMEDYFGYRIRMVMNVTDVDDKIILKARRQHLLRQYKDSKPAYDQVKDRVKLALEATQSKRKQEVDDLQRRIAQALPSREKETTEGLLNLATKALRRSEGQLEELTQPSYQASADRPCTTAELFAQFGDVLEEAADQEGGAEVTDHQVFQSHARRFERDFQQDMDALGVRRAEAMPRVSEWVPEILQYIEVIIQKGFAYKSAGSVFFDTCKFESSGHSYRKLCPTSASGLAHDESTAAAESEADFTTNAKKNPRDFALWKAAKPGEPSWSSPSLGPGRPGWHIECSAMATALIGNRIDIHSGGTDLRFPHHDNELAQAEAYSCVLPSDGRHTTGDDSCDCHQWVNYFLHSGHLHIEGLKMSKSLKNFITIKEALQDFTARQLRLMMCLQPWTNTLTYSRQSQGETEVREKEFLNFFSNVQTALREAREAAAARGAASPPEPSSTHWQEEERTLDGQLTAAGAAVHSALCNNIDTVTTLQALSALMTHVNKYLEKRPRPGGGTNGILPQEGLLSKAAAFVMRILSAVGLVFPPWDRPSSFAAESSSDLSGAATEEPFINAFVNLRAEGRRIAQSPDAKNDPGQALKRILELFDLARDDTAAALGIRVEDKSDGGSTWKREDPAVLAADRAEAAERATAARVKKLSNKLAIKKTALSKLQDIAGKPGLQEELRQQYQTEGWTDREGFPSCAADGSSLVGKACAKAEKQVTKLRTVYGKLWEVIQADGDSWQAVRQAEIDALATEISGESTNR